jgi:LCP family protein required for cell wall assembly
MTFQIHHLHDKKPKRKLPLPSPETLQKVFKKSRKLIAFGLLIGKPLYKIGSGLVEKHERRHHMKRAFSIGTAMVVALAILLLAFTLLIKIGGMTMGSLVSVSGIPVGADENGVTNILLLGEGDEAGQNLVDTVIIASLDPVRTKSISLLSVPRDLYFLHTDHAMQTEKGKLNALWRDNAIIYKKKGMEVEKSGDTSLKELAEEIGFAFGIPIHHAVKVDFLAAEKIVDTMGGIDITVPETIHDTAFPDGNYGYETFHIDAGVQHLDGKTALKYARTRSTTSDFDRSSRQQQLVQAALRQAKESGIIKRPNKILELYSILRTHIQTDLSTRQMLTLANIGRALNKEDFLTLQLNNVNGLYGEPLWKGGILYAPPRELFDGDSVLLPISIPEFPVTWKQIQTLTKLFFGNRSLYIQNPTFGIFNAGAPEGSARNISRELTKYGFDVVEVTNVPERKEFPSSNIIFGEKKESAAFFASLLGIDLEERTETWKSILEGKDTGDISIILGEDFEFSRFQDLISL